jgi:hypothetical protein
MLGGLDYHSIQVAVKRAAQAVAGLLRNTDFTAAGQVLMSSAADVYSAVPISFNWRNRLSNPDGGIYQRAVAATADDAYFADRWYILSQTGTVTPSVLTDPEDGFPKGVRITQSQAAAQRFGFAQIIEGRNCKDLRGKSGVLVPRVRVSASQAIRYAVLAWTGTEDSPTSDVVNDWTSTDYTDGAAKFFVDANYTPLVVGAQTPSANTWTSLAAITAALGSTFNNLVVVVWTEGTAAQNFTLDFDYLQFERGSVATDFERRPLAIEQAECFRHCWSYKPSAAGRFGFGHANSTTQVQVLIEHKVRMRVAPTLAISAAGDFEVDDGSAAGIAVTAIAIGVGGTDNTELNCDVAAGLTAGNGSQLRDDGGGNARITLSADL